MSRSILAAWGDVRGGELLSAHFTFDLIVRAKYAMIVLVIDDWHFVLCPVVADDSQQSSNTYLSNRQFRSL